MESSTQDDSISSAPPLSKNAIKKAKRAEKYAAIKLERRAREKEKKKEKKLLNAQERAHGANAHLDDVDKEGLKRGEKRARKDGEEKTKEKAIAFGARVVVDLGFDELMTDNVSMLASVNMIFS